MGGLRQESVGEQAVGAVPGIDWAGGQVPLTDRVPSGHTGWWRCGQIKRKLCIALVLASMPGHPG